MYSIVHLSNLIMNKITTINKYCFLMILCIHITIVSCKSAAFPSNTSSVGDFDGTTKSAASFVTSISCITKVNGVDSCIEYFLPNTSTQVLKSDLQLSCEAGSFKIPQGKFVEKACNVKEYNGYICRDQLTLDGPLFNVYAKTNISDTKLFTCQKPKSLIPNPSVKIPAIGQTVKVDATFPKLTTLKDHIYEIELTSQKSYLFSFTTKGVGTSYNIYLSTPDNRLLRVINIIGSDTTTNVQHYITTFTTGLYSIKVVRQSDTIGNGYEFSLASTKVIEAGSLEKVTPSSTFTQASYTMLLDPARQYNMFLEVASGSNYDLTLYKETESGFLEVDNSQLGTGVSEQIIYTPSEGGIYRLSVTKQSGLASPYTLVFYNDISHIYNGMVSNSTVYQERVPLLKGKTYNLRLTPFSNSTNFSFYLCEQIASSCTISTNLGYSNNLASGSVQNILYTPTTSNLFKFGITRTNSSVGEYTITVEDASIPLNISKTVVFSSIFTPTVQYTINLTADIQYQIYLGVLLGSDANIKLYDSTSTLVGQSFNGSGIDESILYTPTSSGAYRIEISNVSGTGQYPLLISDSVVRSNMTVNSSPISGSFISNSLTGHWYSVSLNTTTPYVITLKPEAGKNYDLFLYNAQGSIKIAQSKNSTNGKNEFILYKTPSSTNSTSIQYLVNIVPNGSAGTYELTTKTLLASTEATNVSFNFNTAETIAYTLNLASYTKYNFTFTNLPSTSSITLYNPQGDFVFTGNKASFSYTSVSSGSYILQIKNDTILSSTGSSFKFEKELIALELNTWVYGSLSLSDTERWYTFKFNKNTTGTYRIWLYSDSANGTGTNVAPIFTGDLGYSISDGTIRMLDPIVRNTLNISTGLNSSTAAYRTLIQFKLSPWEGSQQVTLLEVVGENSSVLINGTVDADTLYFRVSRTSGEGRYGILPTEVNLPPYNFFATWQPQECLVCIADKVQDLQKVIGLPTGGL